MNRSLGSLRALLLQEPQQQVSNLTPTTASPPCLSQYSIQVDTLPVTGLCIDLSSYLHQVETQRRVEKADILEHTVHFLQNTGDVDRKKAGVGEQHPFQDGFSACLQRAACFLGPKGEALLSSPLSARVVSQSAGVTIPPVQPSNALPIGQMLLQDSRYRQQSCDVYKTCPVSLQHRDTNAPQHSQRQAIKQARSQNLSTSQTLWRPWP